MTVPLEVGNRLNVAFWITLMGSGAVTEVTEKPLAQVPVWLSGLVTVTLRVPIVAVGLMEILAVSCVVELNAHEFTVIPASKLQVAPL